MAAVGHPLAHLVALHADGKHTPAELAELFSIGRSTVYRAHDRAKARTDHSNN